MTDESIATQARAADLAKVRQARGMTEEQRILSAPFHQIVTACPAPPMMRISWLEPKGFNGRSISRNYPKDFADVVAVMQVQGPARLDWPYIEEW